MEPTLREQLTRGLVEAIPPSDGPMNSMGNLMADPYHSAIIDVDRIVSKAIYDLQKTLISQLRGYDFDFVQAIEKTLGEPMDDRMLLRLGLIEEWQVGR